MLTPHATMLGTSGLPGAHCAAETLTGLMPFLVLATAVGQTARAFPEDRGWVLVMLWISWGGVSP